MPQDHDVVIVGSGSTAFAAALRAQSLGARVLMVEKSVLGGTCVNWGCIPSKTLIHSALFYQEARLGARIGLGIAETGVDYAALILHKERGGAAPAADEIPRCPQRGAGIDGGERNRPLHRPQHAGSRRPG